MPGVISAHASKELTRSQTWVSGLSLHVAPVPPPLPPFRNSYVLYKALSYPPLFLLFAFYTKSATFRCRGVFVCLCEINSHYWKEREKEHVEREGDRLLLSLSVWLCLTAVISLIALLISSLLSLDLGQRGPSAGADFRLSSFVISPAV